MGRTLRGLAVALLQSSALAQSYGNYSYKHGFLAAGDDLPGSGSMTFVQAVAACDANDDCMGFTFDSAASIMPTTPVDVYLKSALNFDPTSDGWATWELRGTVAPPDFNATVGGLRLSLRAGVHTVQILSLVSDAMPPYNFSFVPPLQAFGRPTDRSLPGYHALGDVTLRVQPLTETNTSSWAYYTSAYGVLRAATPVAPWAPSVLAADDITRLVNATPADRRDAAASAYYPLSVNIVRSYETAPRTDGGQDLVLRWNLTATADVRIGGLGFSIVGDEACDQDLPHIAQTNSFVDPHIGLDGGFAEWVRVVGNATLLVTSYGLGTPLQAWRGVMEDPSFGGQISEWSVYSAAWAAEWAGNRQAPNDLFLASDIAAKGVFTNPRSPWPLWRGSDTYLDPAVTSRFYNPPSALELRAGESRSFALRLSLAGTTPRTRDAGLLAAGVPAVQGVPGYVLATDMTSAFLLVTPPPGVTLKSVAVANASVIVAGAPAPAGGAAGAVRVPMTGIARGLTAVLLAFSDGSTTSVHYRVLPPLATQIARMGTHLSTVAWLPLEADDPFGRQASVMPYDRLHGERVLQDSRAYIVGLSDDAGAGQNSAFGMKSAWAPTAFELSRLDDYHRYTLYGTKNTTRGFVTSLQVRPEDAAQGLALDGIRMTTFYYCANPGDCTNTSGSGFFPYDYTEQDKCDMPVGGPIWCNRGFNNPHTTVVWYGLYRASRFYDNLVTSMPWSFYLERAFKTAMYIGSANVGFMEGTVFREVLDALTIEGAENATIAGWAAALGANMKGRADAWATETFPYGSEFAFDTTGQEEVYVWLSRYGYEAAANRTLNSILAFMRHSPTWAYNGGARSLGDLGNNGLVFVNRGNERILMHYRAGLNAIPIMEQYLSFPDDTTLLTVAMGSHVGVTTNIDDSGAVSMGFHASPFVLDHDPRSGDYGLAHFGMALETGAVVVNDPTYGWLCYLCNIGSSTPTSISLAVVDGYRVRAYLEPLGTQVVVQAGNIASIALDLAAASATLTFAPATSSPAGAEDFAAPPYSALRIVVTKRAIGRRPGSNFVVSQGGVPCPVVRGAFSCAPAPSGPSTAILTWSP